MSKRTDEADQASVAFQLALTQIGAKTLEDALELWSEMPPDLQPATASRWLGRAIRLVMFRRSRSQALALAYYRLARALRTGTTIADPYNPEPTYVSLSTLRREFAALSQPSQGVGASQPVGQDSPAADPAGTPPPSDPEPSEAPQADADEDDDLVLVEDIDGLAAELERLRIEAEAEARDQLADLGPLLSQSKQAKVDKSGDADTVIAEIQKAHASAGNQQASVADKLAKDGARSTIYATGGKDPKVIGWIRLSRTGTPCGWCAMLISRGFTDKSGLYASKGAAQHQGKGQDENKYHNNCNCYAEPVYSQADLQSPRFDLNRHYAALWPKVTKGLGGRDALNAWRTYIRQTQATPVQATEAA